VLGISWADVEAKYRALVPHAQPGADRIEQSLAVIRNFRHTRHPSELTGWLQSSAVAAPALPASEPRQSSSS
jgi:hypothetical protein